MEVAVCTPLVKVILKGSCFLLWYVGRQWAKDKLDDDSLQSEIIQKLIQGLDTVVEKLDKEAKKDLGASICHYKEGLAYLKEVLGNVHAGKQSTVGVQTGEESYRYRSSAISAGKVLHYLNTAKQAKVDTSAGTAISKAKRAFHQASNKATEAFSNENLDSFQRVQALSIRVMANILEDIENPMNAFPACRSCLDDLHSRKIIKKIFQDALSKKAKQTPFRRNVDERAFEGVCQLHRLVYEVAELAGKGRGPWTRPCITMEDTKEKIDPLRDARIAETLCKLQLGYLSLRREVDQNEEPEPEEPDKQLKSARDLASNKQGEIAVVDDDDDKIKVFDRNSTNNLCFSPLSRHLADEEVWGVAINDEGNFLVLIKIDYFHFQMCIFDKNGRPRHRFRVKEGFVLCSPVVNKDNEIFVLKAEGQGQAVSECFVVEKYKDGQFDSHFGEKVLKDPKDMTVTDDGRVMVLNISGNVDVFNAEGNHLNVLTFGVVSAEAIAFHSESKHVAISNLSEGIVKILIFPERGECLCSIYQSEQTRRREESPCIAPKMTMTSDGIIGILVGVIGQSKVIVM